MKQNTPWTDQELNQARIAFLKGEQIKIIADKLGRSISSLNKILTRYRIRKLSSQDPQPKGYIKWNPRDSYCKNKLPPIIEYKSLKPRPERTKTQPTPKPLKKEQRLIKDNPWVSLGEVITYIKRKGISIETFHLDKTSAPTAYKEATFFLDKKPCSPLKVVLFANKLRLEERKPTFLIKEVTW